MDYGPAQGRSRVFHGHTFAEIGTVEGPGVDDLLSVGIDDLNVLALLEGHGLAPSGRDGNAGCGCHARTSSVYSTAIAPPPSAAPGCCALQMAPAKLAGAISPTQ